MITYETIIMQMEQALAQAKQAKNEQQMREQLTAVKALCDVVLRDASTGVAPMIQPVSSTPQVPSISTVKIQETGANGDSIFDF